jgi:hypothetical protein
MMLPRQCFNGEEMFPTSSFAAKNITFKSNELYFIE